MQQDADELPTLDEIEYLIQQSILHDYPNPERKGCVNSHAIRVVAYQSLPNEQSGWEHISQCSPCYREFLEERSHFQQKKARSTRHKRLVILVVAMVLVGVSAALFLKMR